MKFAALVSFSVGLATPAFAQSVSGLNTGRVIQEILLLVFLAGIYVLPTVLTILRNHPEKKSVIILNLCFGWTLLGWLIAMVWSVLPLKMLPFGRRTSDVD